jgi:hypothetical protein
MLVITDGTGDFGTAKIYYMIGIYTASVVASACGVAILMRLLRKAWSALKSRLSPTDAADNVRPEAAVPSVEMASLHAESYPANAVVTEDAHEA